MSTADRQLAPDVARGFCLAFIAIANVMLYLHDRPYGLRQHLIEHGVVDRVVSLVTVALIDARIYPLFAVLLGYGIARQSSRGDPARTDRRLRLRGLGLVVFGALHGILLFSGDILGLYGLITIALVPASRSWSNRRLLLWAAVLWVPLSAIQGIALSDVGPTMQRSIFWSIGIADPVEALLWRVPEWVMGMLGMLGVVPATLAGIWAGRQNLLALPSPFRRQLGRLGLVGAVVGVVGGMPSAAVVVGLIPLEPGVTAVVISVVHVVTGVIGGLGYAALIGWVCGNARVARSATAGALAAVGQRSLTCYLLQSVLMVPFLPAWTLAWGRTYGSAQAALFALGVYLVTVVIAVLLRRFGDRRPAESLLRGFVSLLDRRAYNNSEVTSESSG
jgi:uncharacterized protein